MRFFACFRLAGLAFLFGVLDGNCFGGDDEEGTDLLHHVAGIAVRRLDDADAIDAGHQFPPVGDEDQQKDGHDDGEPLTRPVAGDGLAEVIEGFENPFDEIL